MEKDKHKTEIVFRLWKEQEIALFPYIIDTFHNYTIMSYMIIGQHGGADYDYIIKNSKPISNPENTKIYKELVGEFGHNIKVIKRRNTKKYNRIFKEEYIKINGKHEKD